MFRFKQFTVEQHLCAMKVNTDGVLLGAWAIAHGSTTQPVDVLDIGTGTGVIALMCAQAMPLATIDAIDIDSNAAAQAAANFGNSPWAARLRAANISLQHMVTTKAYDFIVSNPPYFLDDYKSGDNRRDVARHSTALTYSELMTGIDRLLTDNGIAFVIIPVFNFDILQQLAEEKGLFVTYRTNVMAVEGKPPYVTLVRLQKERSPVVNDTITIQHSNGNFTDSYRQLTKEFYLKF